MGRSETLPLTASSENGRMPSHDHHIASLNDVLTERLAEQLLTLRSDSLVDIPRAMYDLCRALMVIYIHIRLYLLFALSLANPVDSVDQY